MATFSNILAKAVLQEYVQVANNTKLEASMAAYQGLENYLTLVYIAVEA